MDPIAFMEQLETQLRAQASQARSKITYNHVSDNSDAQALAGAVTHKTVEESLKAVALAVEATRWHFSSQPLITHHR